MECIKKIKNGKAKFDVGEKVITKDIDGNLKWVMNLDYTKGMILSYDKINEYFKK